MKARIRSLLAQGTSVDLPVADDALLQRLGTAVPPPPLASTRWLRGLDLTASQLKAGTAVRFRPDALQNRDGFLTLSHDLSSRRVKPLLRIRGTTPFRVRIGSCGVTDQEVSSQDGYVAVLIARPTARRCRVSPSRVALEGWLFFFVDVVPIR